LWKNAEGESKEETQKRLEEKQKKSRSNKGAPVLNPG
jgi:hypothetical protein